MRLKRVRNMFYLILSKREKLFTNCSFIMYIPLPIYILIIGYYFICQPSLKIKKIKECRFEAFLPMSFFCVNNTLIL